MSKVAEERDTDGWRVQGDDIAESGGVDEWGMLMANSPSRLDLASDMLPAGLSDRPSTKSFGE